MNSNNLDLFIEAAEEIFKEIGFPNLTIEDCNIKDQKHALVASIGLTGGISGFLLIRSDISSSMAFIGKMLSNMGMESEESDFGQFHKEAFGEILNQISGRAAMLLESAGVDCNITPPTILKGQNISIGNYETSEIVHKTINGSFGYFDLLIGAKE
jgi:chemotaxis protein CheX